MSGIVPQGNLSHEFAPVKPEERIAILDVLRGFALFGILVMNMSMFSAPWSALALDPPLFPGMLDQVARFVMDFLFSGKANSIFTFLFGLGLTIQMQRADERARSLVAMYLRRLAVLFVIGVAHALLLWDGDVLHIYAVLGLFLLVLRRVPDKVVLGLIVFSFVAPELRSSFALYHHEPAPYSMDFYAALAREQLQIFQHGSYADQVNARVHDYEIWYSGVLQLRGYMWTYASFATTMLLGFLAGRRRIFHDLPGHLPWMRKVTGICLGLGLALAVGFAIILAITKPTGHPTVLRFCMALFGNVSRPLLCMGYIGGITLLFQKPAWQRLFLPVASAGRFPLTNYLMQTVIATTLFYSYGLGLYGKVGPALGLWITAAIFTIQVLYSHFWVKRFRYGPLEWLWRGASYGKLPRIRA